MPIGSSLSVGDDSTCVVTTVGDIYCWGHNNKGQLGNGTTTDSNIPVQAATGHTWASVSVGYQTACAVTTGGAGYCWGLDDYGQLGQGSGGSWSSTPVLVTGSHTWSSISVGYGHSCGVTTGNAAYCWGSNNYGGSLGIGGGGTPSQMNVPALVAGSHSWSVIRVGYTQACGVTTAGAAYCWGHNPVGNGTTNDYDVPTLVSGSHTWADINPGDGVNCGYDTLGAGWCWGVNTLGALGDGTNNSDNVPVAVTGSHVYVGTGAGGGGGCGLVANGDVYCWGYDGDGRLGDGGSTNRNYPVLALLAAVVSSNTVSATIDPSFTFSVAGRSTACNGQTSSGFSTSSSSTAVSLGHLTPSSFAGGAQDLSVVTNAGGGFIVYLRTPGTTPNALRAGSAYIAM